MSIPRTWSVNCCGAQLSGPDTAHCPSCCHTFDTPAAFDRHRRYGKCLDPADLVDVFRDAGRRYPCWSLK